MTTDHQNKETSAITLSIKVYRHILTLKNEKYKNKTEKKTKNEIKAANE